MSKNLFKESLKALKTVRGLALCAILIAISCVLCFLKWGITLSVNITFFFLPVSVAALLLGPIPAAIVGGVADILGAVITPTGPYFPGFTLNMIIVGLIYGIFFFKEKPRLWKIILVRLIIALVVDLALTPLWLHLLYSTPLVWAFWVERFIKCAIVIPIEVVLMFTVNTALSRLNSK
ncbi:MAG: folate family ECF transporter S component [Ruminococcaceae bacterium]|nr:folate family ECF transporter S component [Oscillospiraceae bacterium]